MIRMACVLLMAVLFVFAGPHAGVRGEVSFTSPDAWTPEWFQTGPATEPGQPLVEVELEYETIYDDLWNETGWTVFASFTELHGCSLKIQKIAARWFCGGQGNVVLRDQIFDTEDAIRSAVQTDTLEAFRGIPLYFQASFPAGYEDRKKIDGIGVVLCGADPLGNAYEFRGYLVLPRLEDAPAPEPGPEEAFTPEPIMIFLPETEAPQDTTPEPTPEPVAVTEAPTPEPVIVTEAPTPEPVIVTEAPTPEPVIVTEAPTPEPVVVTEAPTPGPIIVTVAPTPDPAAPAEEPPAPEQAVLITPTPEPAAVTEEPSEPDPAAIAAEPPEADPAAVAAEPPAAEPAETPIPGPILVQQGDIVFFGRNPDGGAEEPLEWLVLDADRENGTLLVVSRYAAGAMAFSSKATAAYSWENSIVREWLNGIFLNTAFTPEEQAAIQDTEVDLSEAQGLRDWNSAGRAAGSTRDKLFLLSALEVRKYLVRDEWRLCAVPDGAAEKAYLTSSKELNGRKTCDYWLRNAAYKTNAGIVRADGTIDKESMNNGRGAVRPAMWVSIYAVYLEGE